MVRLHLWPCCAVQKLTRLVFYRLHHLGRQRHSIVDSQRRCYRPRPCHSDLAALDLRGAYGESGFLRSLVSRTDFSVHDSPSS